MIYKKYFPALVCGFGASVLSVVPVLNGFVCCMILPFASYFSIQLYKKVHHHRGQINIKEAIIFGLLTGLVTAFFSTGLDTLITAFAHNNEFAQSLPESKQMLNEYFKFPPEQFQFFEDMAYNIQNYGFSLPYTIMIFISLLIVYPIFGLIGGVISMLIINKKSDVL